MNLAYNIVYHDRGVTDGQPRAAPPEGDLGRTGTGMRVLVLGGNRYIGLQLVFELARRGHELTVLN
ncbi:MAG: hypothetical protein QOG64_1923, partial [Acidimicrobiaceae bacterium]|nr:hypothetical protein [Acidimicrobiaceae bacterium]